MFLHRVITGPKSWSQSRIFLESEPSSVWRKILENHMNDESFMKSSEALKNLKSGNELMTMYDTIGK